jgi:hypothetical protein
MLRAYPENVILNAVKNLNGEILRSAQGDSFVRRSK